METFADYILSEKDWVRKMEIVYYLQKKTGIYLDKSIPFKTAIAKLFIEVMELDVDPNIVITACLLCNCKKTSNPQDLDKIKSYAKEGADYLSSLGFSKRFCRICEQVNRYSESEPREPEADILELVDQFGGMLLHRPERIGFKPDEAIVLLEYRNLKDRDNMYLEKFKEFVSILEETRV